MHTLLSFQRTGTWVAICPQCALGNSSRFLATASSVFFSTRPFFSPSRCPSLQAGRGGLWVISEDSSASVMSRVASCKSHSAVSGASPSRRAASCRSFEGPEVNFRVSPESTPFFTLLSVFFRGREGRVRSRFESPARRPFPSPHKDRKPTHTRPEVNPQNAHFLHFLHAAIDY